jgi:LEA14-like dessication related protein
MTIRRVKGQGWIGMAMGVLVAACSSMPKDFEAPKVHIADMTPKDMTLFEQRFDVKLRIQNANDADLGITGLRFDIELNNREFANGMSGQHVTVPRFGSELVDVEVFTTLASFLRQVQELNAGEGQKMKYRLKGTAFVESPGIFKAPFDEQGEIELKVGDRVEKPEGMGRDAHRP